MSLRHFQEDIWYFPGKQTNVSYMQVTHHAPCLSVVYWSLWPCIDRTQYLDAFTPLHTYVCKILTVDVMVVILYTIPTLLLECVVRVQ